ncbi:hypothetical protein PG994_003802 [Apiospora phragmitis]|uniref:Uncharacterized protein n=1 Tax=Apiospora phragmitis TaxID=2905665 RepID=A0ABR1VZ51_9PEZI
MGTLRARPHCRMSPCFRNVPHEYDCTYDQHHVMACCWPSLSCQEDHLKLVFVRQLRVDPSLLLKSSHVASCVVEAIEKVSPLSIFGKDSIINVNDCKCVEIARGLHQPGPRGITTVLIGPGQAPGAPTSCYPSDGGQGRGRGYRYDKTERKLDIDCCEHQEYSASGWLQ